MADWNAEIGHAVPYDVWHGRRLRSTVPPLTARAANALLARLLPLAERIEAGYSTDWDGNNHVGNLNTDAQAAADEVDRICEEAREYGDNADTMSGMDAGEWWHGAEPTVTAETTDEDLDEMAEDAEDAALADNLVLEGARQYLYDARAAIAKAQE